MSSIFLPLVEFFESCNSTTMLALVLTTSFLMSYMLYDPEGKRKRFADQLKRIPGPTRLPLVGNAVQMIFPPEEIFTWLEEVYKEWGDIVVFWIFGSPKVFINSYDIAMQLLSRKDFLLKSEEFEPLAPIGEFSLPGASPRVHPIKRKILGPGFSRSRVEESYGIISKHVFKMCDHLIEMADKGSRFDLLDYTGLYSYMIGCESAFGSEIMETLNESDYRQQLSAWHRMLVNLVHRSMQPWLKYDFIYNLTPKGMENLECFKIINEFGRNAITLKRANRKSPKTRSSLDLKKPQSFLDLLLDLEERQEVTAEDVLHELNIYIAAGYDTTGTTAAWVLHLLASYPEHQNKVVEELHEIFGSSKSDTTKNLEVTPADTKRMKYLEVCIKETLRLYPVLPWLLRRTDEDVCLKDGRIIPANVDVPINLYTMHRDPKYFPHPEEFRPERHSSDSPARSFSIPFGAGPRICIGMLFAMHELKVILTHLLLSYSWESLDNPKEIKCFFQGVLRPANGINVRIKKR